METSYYDLVLLNKQLTNNIRQENYDSKYLYYLVQNKLTKREKHNILLKTNGIFTLLKHTLIYGNSIYELLNNTIKDMTFNIYFLNQETLDYLVDFFKDYIIEKSDTKILILYQNIQLIFHIKRIYKNQLELFFSKENHKYNCCLINNTMYYSPVSYYLISHNINPLIGNMYDTRILSSIINDINLPLNDLIQKYTNINYLYTTLLTLGKFDYFKIFIKSLPKDFFTENYIIFEMIKKGKIDFFNILNKYEKTTNTIFNLNTLNKEGLTPPEYCLFRANELISNQNIPINIKEQIINRYKSILNNLMYNRSINNQYTRNIVFFDCLLQTNFIKHQTIYNILYSEVNIFLKNKSKQSILNDLSEFSIKHINSVYLNIYYVILNDKSSFISIDDIIDFIVFNKEFIDIHSILQICKSNNSQIVLTELIKQNIINLNDFDTIKIFFDLKYFKILENHKTEINNNINNIMVYLINTLNLEALLFINDNYSDAYNIKLNNNDTLFHYLVNIKEETDENLTKQIGIIKDILYMFHPELLNKVNNDNETILFKCKSPEIFKVILELNPDLSILNNDGNSIIHHLILTNNIELLNILIKFTNKSLNIKNKNNDLPIIYSIKINNIQLALNLLNFNYSTDEQDIIQTYFNLHGMNIKFNNKQINDEYHKYYVINTITEQFK